MTRTLRWACWLLGVLGSFAWLETWAVKTGQTTLSQALRAWLGIHPRRARRHVTGALFVGLWVWLSGHIVAGWGP